jgi:PRC-barrel domain
MLKRFRRVLAAIAVTTIALMPSIATAQAPPVPKPVPVSPAQTAKEYRVKQVLGTKVHIQGNISIGTVDDIVFGDDGRIEYLLVLNDGKYVSVPWKAATFNFDKQMAVVNITQEQYRVIPNFGLGLFPRFLAPTYRVETYKYYGLTPEQQLQAERAP